MKKKINISIQSTNNITLKEATELGTKIEASLPKNIQVEWWGWSSKKSVI